MRTIPLINAKAGDANSRSNSIVVSFNSNWYDGIKESRLTGVIRKRAPTTFTPTWIYFHINSPKSAVCAKSEILSIESIEPTKAFELKHELDMSEGEIRDYLGGSRSVFLYRIGPIYYPDTEGYLHELRRHMIYHPPQSFFALSVDGKLLLDQLCGFPPQDQGRE